MEEPRRTTALRPDEGPNMLDIIQLLRIRSAASTKPTIAVDTELTAAGIHRWKEDLMVASPTRSWQAIKLTSSFAVRNLLLLTTNCQVTVRKKDSICHLRTTASGR